MVKPGKHIAVEAVEEKEMPIESFSVVAQLLASWIVREIHEEANRRDENPLTTNPTFYTLQSKNYETDQPK